MIFISYLVETFSQITLNLVAFFYVWPCLGGGTVLTKQFSPTYYGDVVYFLGFRKKL